jgi:hypothetical protein
MLGNLDKKKEEFNISIAKLKKTFKFEKLINL